tara:strand:+ start:151 stop:894 length:744 start_codon:yes stop_codon:yes gene_type:complete
MLRHVDLCSGIGGFALGFEWAGLSKPVLFCDIEQWSRKVLAKHWPDVPIAYDVKELANDPARLVPDCDILTAGYPCQPFSLASRNRKGEADDRHIWPYIKTIVSAKHPSWLVFENVKGHISLGLASVIDDLSKERYTAIPLLLSAFSVGAIHERARLYIVAYSNDRRSALRWDRQLSENAEAMRCRSSRRERTPQFDTRQWRQIQSRPYGVVDGISERLDRNRALGNAIVPSIAMRIGQTIKAVHDG